MIRNILFLSVFFSFLGCSHPKNTTKIRLGYDVTFFNSNEHSAKIKGFFDEIVVHLEKKGVGKIEFVPTSEDNLVDLLQRGQIDFIFSDLDQNIINKSKFLFSVDLVYNGLYLVTQKGDDRELKNLQHKRVMAPTTDFVTFLIAQYPDVNFSFYEDYKEAFLTLITSSCSACVVPAMVAPNFATEFFVQPNPLSNKYITFIANKDSAHFEQLDRRLHQLVKEKVIEQLKQKWQLEPNTAP
jgi:ABC-type amino acid transport substrate-binding protein